MEVTQKEFHTESLPFACFLISAKKLRFLRCEHIAKTGRVSFIFEDPEFAGEQMYLDFTTGAEVPAAAFFDSIRHLRKIMDHIQGARYERINCSSK